MTTKFELNFGDIFRFPLRLAKSTDDGKVPVESGYRTSSGELKKLPSAPFRLIPKDGKSVIKKPEDIDHFVGWNETLKIYAIDDTKGREKYVEVDVKAMKETLYPKSDKMHLIAYVPTSSIGFHQMTGAHYYVQCQNSNKKMPTEDDKMVYALLHEKLLEDDRVMVVKYISYNTEKYAIIYPNGEFLKLSQIVYSDLQREPPVSSPVAEAVEEGWEINPETADIFLAAFKKDKLEETEYRDKSGQEIAEYIEARANNPDEALDNIKKSAAKKAPTGGRWEQLLRMNRDPQFKKVAVKKAAGVTSDDEGVGSVKSPEAKKEPVRVRRIRRKAVN